ncbi:LANO_0A04720g1_1 [Lachancea nothofagi CBS 11611]|uniref:LANO_0A04720g1_1 n=1 Tax=Lachancea nothofagi CBS 11611 TaxID=1266666 RepID=A0A1G4IQI7_9SACH|nr:LANO_0A04720g1_1 [Lachancea nothofagi CBS 11611]
MRAGLWIVAVVGYVIQTKTISHIYTDSTNKHLDALYLVFSHFLAWTLVGPLTQLFCRLKYGTTGRHGLWHRAFWAAPPRTPDLERSISGSCCSKWQLKRFLRIVVLASLLGISLYTFFVALGLSPALDVAIIHNLSMFEIVSLLLVVAGVASRRCLLRNFALMLVILLGILVVSYTKDTCDMLSGKVSINPKTGELDDPFLFDRLKGALICGLGSLTVGPASVMWHNWTATAPIESEDLTAPNLNARETSYILNYEISSVGAVALLIFGPLILLSSKESSINQVAIFKSAWILISIFAGHIPMILALVHLSERVSPQFTTTCFVGSIVFVALAEWIAESGQTIITRWEVIGYLTLSIAGLILAYQYWSSSFKK